MPIRILTHYGINLLAKFATGLRTKSGFFRIMHFNGVKTAWI
tara:strand:+ start:9971 stop:10096 length:126 start_codon:yes stop_codon:yes gene_type:complete